MIYLVKNITDEKTAVEQSQFTSNLSTKLHHIASRPG